MVIGVPKEIKKGEFRVGMTPYGVEELKADGNSILVETGGGEGSDFSDDEYRSAGAQIVEKEDLFSKADLIVKVKEPIPSEYGLLKSGQAIFTFLHLAANRELIEVLLKKKITGLGYETLMKDGGLPLLSPMSEIAGRMAPIMGAYFLQKIHGGAGILPTGVMGVEPAKALILGAGIVGPRVRELRSSRTPRQVLRAGSHQRVGLHKLARGDGRSRRWGLRSAPRETGQERDGRRQHRQELPRRHRSPRPMMRRAA